MNGEYRVRVKDGRFITISGQIEDVEEAVLAIKEYGERNNLTSLPMFAQDNNCVGEIKVVANPCSIHQGFKTY